MNWLDSISPNKNSESGKINYDQKKMKLFVLPFLCEFSYLRKTELSSKDEILVGLQ